MLAVWLGLQFLFSTLLQSAEPIDAYSPVTHADLQGERIIFLHDAPYGKRRWDGFSGFGLGKQGLPEGSPSVEYSTLAGRIGFVEEARDLGTRFLFIIRMEDTGEYFSSFIYPPLNLGSPVMMDRAAIHLPGVARILDVEEARSRWIGNLFILNVNDLQVLNPETGEPFSFFIGKDTPVRVVDVIPGWDERYPVRVVVSTAQGVRGFFDVHTSRFNLPTEFLRSGRIGDYLTPLTFGHLGITSVQNDMDFLRVEGVTDLPDGAMVTLSTNLSRFPAKYKASKRIYQVPVYQGKFKAEFPVRSVGRQIRGAPCEILASFDPSVQSDAVRWWIGTKGEGLAGSGCVEISDGSAILVAEWRENREECSRLFDDENSSESIRRQDFVTKLRDRFSERNVEADVYVHGRMNTHIGIVFPPSAPMTEALALVYRDEFTSLGFTDLSLHQGEENACTLPLQVKDPLRLLRQSSSDR